MHPHLSEQNEETVVEAVSWQGWGGNEILVQSFLALSFGHRKKLAAISYSGNPCIHVSEQEVRGILPLSQAARMWFSAANKRLPSEPMNGCLCGQGGGLHWAQVGQPGAGQWQSSVLQPCIQMQTLLECWWQRGKKSASFSFHFCLPGSMRTGCRPNMRMRGQHHAHKTKS